MTPRYVHGHNLPIGSNGLQVMIGTHTDELAIDGDGQTSLILTVKKSGAVSGVVEGPESLHELFASDANSVTVDSIWDEECAERIHASLRRALRSRTSCSFQMDDQYGAVTEFFFLPRGADRLLLMVRDLTQQKQLEKQTHRLAYTDDVTGLPNREYLFTELQKVIEVQRLKEGRSAVICMHIGDLDDYGYPLSAGQQDEVLSHLANRLENQLRGTNQGDESEFDRYSVVSRDDYRQFCVVLPSIESGEDAETVAERLVSAVSVPVNLKTRTVSIDASSGIALYPQDGTDAESLYENALAAMEDARCQQGGDVKFHSGTVRLRTLQRSDLEAELKSALHNQEYDLNYLPTIDFDSGMPVAMEALLRWPDTVLGSQPIRKIVRVAERTGLIIPIGGWVLTTACQQLSAWREAGYDDLRIAVNVSSQELVGDGMVGGLQQVLDETGIDPAALDLEINESFLARDAATGFALCNQLADLGVRLVVDDYGAGSCSLVHLVQSKVGAIKVDRSIISCLTNDENSETTVAAALAMASQLNIDVVCVGVETQQQFEGLQALGCRYAQGFLLAEPMNAETATEFLAKATAERGCVNGS